MDNTITQASPPFELGIITSANIAQLSVSAKATGECDDCECDDCECDDCSECSDCIGCVG